METSPPGRSVRFRSTVLFRVFSILIPVFATAFVVSIRYLDASMTTRLYAEVARKSTLALANLRTAASMLIKDGREDQLQRLVENAGVSRLVKRIRIAEADGMTVIASTDPYEAGARLESALADELVRKNRLLLMTEKTEFKRGFEVVVPVSGAVFESGKGTDTEAVLQYLADTGAEFAVEREVLAALAWQNAFLLLLALGLLFAAWHFFVSRQLRKFSEVAAAVSRGDYSAEVRTSSRDEFALFADSFNRMIGEVGRKNEELMNYSVTLERHVAERTESLVRKNEELERTRKLVLEAERTALAGRIAGGVAHEINNPAGFVMSNLETLEGYIRRFREPRAGTAEDEEELAWALEDSPVLLSESLAGMRRIVEIVRRLEISAFPNKGECREADLSAVLGSAVAKTCGGPAAAGRLTERRPATLMVRCSPERLELAFMNILANAVDSAGTDGGIVVEASSASGSAVVSVSDSGPGIRQDLIEHIFEPFFTTKAPGKGTGLGLAVAKAVIEAHGGTIAVASGASRTTFSVTLPLEAEAS